MTKMVKILSIDGGGIRGVIPAMVMAELEKRTSKPIAELFDLFSGTSTGGILALGINMRDPENWDKPNFSAREVIKIYEDFGSRIFSRSVWHRLHAVGSLLEEKYPAEGIESVLNEFFGDARLKDSLKDVIITSYEIERRFPFFFKSRKARDSSLAGYDFPIAKVARATSAAPTYFEPVKIEVQGSADYYALVDGGVYANNPALCALVEAQNTYPDADEFLLVSLGTGQLTRPLPYDEVVGWGIAQWAQPIIDVVFDGVSDTVDYQLNTILNKPGQAKRFYRFQVKLDTGSDEMDDASKKNIRALKLLAEELINKEEEQLKEVCDLLRE